MPRPPDSAPQLRQRAHALHSLARLMTTAASSVATLIAAAGSDTWTGPRASQLLDDLRRARARVLAESEGVVVRARRLERLADELDASAARGFG